jgi:hypothetical protein
MTVSTTDIPVLHSVDVAHLYPQAVIPNCHGVVRTPYTLSVGKSTGRVTEHTRPNPKMRRGPKRFACPVDGR